MVSLQVSCSQKRDKLQQLFYNKRCIELLCGLRVHYAPSVTSSHAQKGFLRREDYPLGEPSPISGPTEEVN